MKKKRSIGVTVFSAIYFLLGIAALAGIPFHSVQCMNYLNDLDRYFEQHYHYSNSSIHLFISIIVLLLSSLQIFKLNSLGYKLAVFPLIIFSIPPCGSYVFIFLLLAHIYYFTRPKVKEQFKQS